MLKVDGVYAAFKIVAVCLFFVQCVGFRWQLKESFDADKYFTFSERFMFASGNGPLILEQGPSYIDVDLTLSTLSTSNTSTRVVCAIFATEEDHRRKNPTDLCDGKAGADANSWTVDMYTIELPTSYVATVPFHDLIENVTYPLYQRSAVVKYKYSVKNELWHNVVFLMCPMEGNPPKEFAEIDGLVTFRNPYGFIPAELYGILPFEGARMVAYVLFSCFFLFYYCQNRESVLPLHNAFLAVFLFALAEATMWYASYQSLNLNGEPYCCPFPPTVVASLVLQIFRQTFARTLLLVVCLGYGIVRPKLMTAEWIAIIIVTILYLIAAIIAQVSDIILVQDGEGDPSNSTVLAFKVPELIMDVIFLTWIYLAINSTIRILTEFQQTVKLKMYQQLVSIIGIFAALFTVATIVFVLDDAQIISWPWQWSWVQQVLWESLNFAVLAAVCFICKPTENSRMLSYASQLPTEDPDEDDDIEGDIKMSILKGSKGPSKASEKKVVSYAENNDDDEEDYFTAKRGHNDKSGFSSLNSGENDEDYGLGDD